MDFSNFPNINARITAWGGIKQTAFNKKKYAAAEASWNLLSPQEIAMLDQQIPYGVEAFSFVATPTAILVYEAKTSIRADDGLLSYRHPCLRGEDGARDSNSRYHVDLWKCS